MSFDKEMVSPCGLYCGVCGVLIAHKENNQKLKEKLAPVYGVKVEEVRCKGCMSDEVFVFCQTCPVKACAKNHGYEGCYECNDFPCTNINEFPFPLAKKVMLRAIPRWQELGTERWLEEETSRYVCHNCGSKLFRGIKRCGNCKQPVDLD